MDSSPLENANNSAKKVRRSRKQLNSNTQAKAAAELNGNSNIANTANNNTSNNNNSLGTSSSSQNSQPILHTEMLNYVNKLEYLALKTRLQLHRERKAYSHLFSSLGQFFDSKGIVAKQVQDYVDSVVMKLHDDRDSVETHPEDLDWLKFIKSTAKEHSKSSNDPNSLPLNNGSSLNTNQQGQVQAPGATAAVTIQGQQNSNGSNVIRLPISRQVEQQQPDKAKSQIGKINMKRGSKIESSIDDSDEPKLKRKKRNEPTTTTNSTVNYSNVNSEATAFYQQPQQQQQQQQYPQVNYQQATTQQSVQQQNYMTQQEIFIQNLLKAQQRNQIAANNLPYDQIMQQMLLAYQQQPQQQQQQSMEFPLED